MKAILLLIIGLPIIMVGAASEDEHSVTLKWGENASFPPYNITAIDFSPGTVEEQPDICNNETKYNELNNYERTSYGCDDYVFLNISKKGSHVMDAVLSKVNRTIHGAEFTNETTYEDDEGSIKIHVQDITSGYYIITPYASLDIIIEQNESTELDIANNLTINKIVHAEAHVSPCYQFIPVALTVKNIGNLNFSYISVADDAGGDFESQPNDLKWSIALRSGEMWQAQYLIKPRLPVAGAEYTLPPAMLYIGFYNKTYNLSTGNISFILRSSDIILSKTAGNETKGNITVNLSVQNNGSRAASVKVWDSLLPGMELLGGSMNFSTILQPGDFYNQSYILKLNNISGNISLPPANFTFDEYRACYDSGGKLKATGSGISNLVQINSGITETALKNNGGGTEATTTPTEIRSTSIQNPKTIAETPAQNEATTSTQNSKNTTETPASNVSIIVVPHRLQIGMLEIAGVLLMSIAIVIAARRLFPR